LVILFGKKGQYDSAIWSTGFIASNPAYRYDNQEKFLIDCRSRKGQSGSPVYSYSNIGINQISPNIQTFSGGPTIKFMGIYSGRINEGSDLGFVWKPSIIDEIVNRYK